MKSEGNLWGIYILSNELTDNWSVFINLFLGAYLDLRIMFNVHMVMQYKSFHFSVSPSVSPRKAWWATVHVVAESNTTEQLNTAQQEKAEKEGVWERSPCLHLATESYDHVPTSSSKSSRETWSFPSRWSFHPTTTPYSNCSPNVCFPY